MRLKALFFFGPSRRACVGAPTLAGLALCALLIAPGAQASGIQTFRVFSSPGLDRIVHGRRRDLDLSDGAMTFGKASAFFGVDGLSDNSQHFLTSGISWQSGTRDSPLQINVGAMQTASRGSEIGSQTYMRAESELNLDDRWYVPALSLEADQFASSALAGDNIRAEATRFGLARAGALGGYRLGYFRTGRDFDAWGSSLTPGDRGLELSGHYQLSRRVRIANLVRMHDGPIETGTAHGLVDKWSLAGLGSEQRNQPWRLSGQIGDADRVSDDGMPLAVNLAAPLGRWRAWHIDSSLGWYRGDVTTPDDLPIDGALWRLSFDRRVQLGGLNAFIQPNLAVGGSRYADDDIGTRAGFGVVFPGMLDHVALNVDYSTPGWSDIRGQGDMRMMLSFSQNAGAVVAPLSAWVDQIR